MRSRVKRHFWAGAVALALCASAVAAQGVHCTMPAEMQPGERQALVAAAGRLAQAAMEQDLPTLEAALPPAQKANWAGISATVTQMSPLSKGGHAELRSLYLLDATGQAGTADAQFFCSSANASLTVTVNMRQLPPGRYALVLADAAGSAYAGQIGLLLVWGNGWKLGGITLRQGRFDGHDSVWFWTEARSLRRAGQDWAAWYCYEAARFLSTPVDFLSSPNLEKLANEQALGKNLPAGAFPLTLNDGPRTWKVDAVELDPSLFEADLGVVYESIGVTDLAARRTEATAVMSALLEAHPDLRANFHGLLAYAAKDGKRTLVLELPMERIP